MSNLVASPSNIDLVMDSDQDLTIAITLPAGTYLTGGASGWGLSWIVTEQASSETAIITKTSGGGGIVVTTAGSAVLDALFTITIADDNILPPAIRIGKKYSWKFKRTDAGSEVNMSAGTILFPR